jgi:hypothetical protein
MKNSLPVIALVLIAVLILSYTGLPRNSERLYNCSLVEISPDFPLEVKQKCRELKYENRTMQ